MSDHDHNAVLLHARVNSAADRFCEDLQAAYQATRNWSDASLTGALVRAALDRCLSQLAATHCWGEANRLPSDLLWQRARAFLETGTLQVRARTKPRGYAGDYRMLQQICRHEVGEHPLGRAFDQYFQSQAAPESVRQRTQLIANWIVDRVRRSPYTPTRVISIGSGPAIDIERAARKLTANEQTRLNVVLVDLDPEALESAQARLSPLLATHHLHLHRENLGRLPKNAQALAKLGSAEVVFCSGYFDYLDEAAATTYLRMMRGLTAVDGETIAFNFATGNPSRAYMEWIGNWYLTYRTADELRDIAHHAGTAAKQLGIAAEPSGTSIYLRARS